MVLVKISFPAFFLLDEKRVTFTARSGFFFKSCADYSGIRNTKSTVYLGTKEIHSCKSVALRIITFTEFQRTVRTK